jgi:shikimate kinase
MEKIMALLQYRAPLYERATPNQLATDGKTVTQIVEEILQAVAAGTFK